jgi:hypothetical protein
VREVLHWFGCPRGEYELMISTQSNAVETGKRDKVTLKRKRSVMNSEPITKLQFSAEGR